VSTSTTRDERYNLIAALNRTELLQCVHSLGIEVHPGAPVDLLQEVLLDRIDPASCGIDGNPINAWRRGLITFIGDHWMQLRPQIKCPAQHLRSTDPKLANPRPCFGCTDMKVLSCIHNQTPRATQLITERKQ